MSRTKINWADRVWNPVTGCTPAGVGCQHCYARRMWKRLSVMSDKYRGREFGDVRCHPETLEEPMKWRKPQAVFVNSMGDLFHEAVPFEFVDRVITTMWWAQRHTFVVLTKRPDRMRNYFLGIASGERRERLFSNPRYEADMHAWALHYRRGGTLPRLVLGVSCSTQDEANRMVPTLIAAPADRHVVSLEPLVAPIYLPCDRLISGVIVGGESGPGARLMKPDWVRMLREQCAAAGTPFFFKQWGDNPDRTVYKEPDGGVCAVYQQPHNGRMLDGRTHDDLCWEVAK